MVGVAACGVQSRLPVTGSIAPRLVKWDMAGSEARIHVAVPPVSYLVGIHGSGNEN